MTSRTKLKHIAVFALAFALLGIVPVTLMHALTNVFDTTLIQSDELRALLMISPMVGCMAGLALALFWVCRHPEIL